MHFLLLFFVKVLNSIANKVNLQKAKPKHKKKAKKKIDQTSQGGSVPLNSQTKEREEIGMHPLELVDTAHCANECAYEFETRLIWTAIQKGRSTKSPQALSIIGVIVSSIGEFGDRRLSITLDLLPSRRTSEISRSLICSTNRRRALASARRGAIEGRIATADFSGRIGASN